jgi:hypothetical protein
MGRWVTALFATAAFAAVPVAMSQSNSARSVLRSVLLPPNAQKHVSLSCPAGAVAASAGVKSPGRRTVTLGIWWSGARVADFRVANGRGSPQRITIAATCLGLPGGSGARYRLTRLKKTTVVSGSAEQHVALACPRGTVAAGAGFDLSNGSLKVRRQMRSPSAFSFTVRNGGSRPIPAVLFGTCLTVVVSPGAPPVSLYARVITATTRVQPGAHSLGRACPRGWFGLATGYSLPPAVTLGGSVAISGGGRWSLLNDGSSQALVDLQLDCGRIG